MLKITKYEYLNEEISECICVYESKPLKRFAKQAKTKCLYREFRGRNGIKSIIILNDGGVFLCPYLPNTYYERTEKNDYIQVNQEIYLRKDMIREVTLKPNQQQKEEIRNAKQSGHYVNLCKKRAVGYYVYMRSGRIYGVTNIKDL